MLKIFALITVLTMALSLCACSDYTPVPTTTISTNPTLSGETVPDIVTPYSIEGTWVAEIDIAPAFNLKYEAAFGKKLAKYIVISKLDANITLTFNESKFVCTITAKESAINNLKNDLINGLTRFAEDVISASDEKITVEAAAMNAFGMSIETYVEKMIGEINFKNISYGEYKLDNNKLYMDSTGQYFKISLENNTITFTEYSSEEETDLFAMLLSGVTFTYQ